MRPLTLEQPKVLCPVAGIPLVDHALSRLRSVTDDVTVNVHESAPELVEHLDGRARVSVEAGEALGTAGALAEVRDWIDGRPTVVVNADTWAPGDLAPLVDAWDGEHTVVLVAGDGRFGPGVGVAGAIVPWPEVCRFEARPMGLYEMSWRAADERGEVVTANHHGPFVDCGTPAQYLAANLAANDGASVVEGEVEGSVTRCVVWPGARVRAGERLVDAIRTPHRTVLVR